MAAAMRARAHATGRSGTSLPEAVDTEMNGWVDGGLDEAG